MADGIEGSSQGGGVTKMWVDELPQDLKESPALKDYKDITSLAKSHVELQKMLGNSIRPPGPDATPEDRKKFADDLKAKVPGLLDKTDEKALWESLGRPSTPDAYVPPEGVKLADNDLMAVRKYALETGLTVSQAQKVFKQRAEANEAALARQATANEELKREWGTATEERKALAVVNAEKMGAPAALIEAVRTGNADASTVKWLYNVARSVGSEGNNFGREPGVTRTPSMTPQEAEAQIAELQKDPAWRNESDANHRAKVMRMVQLVEIANAGKPVGDGLGMVVGDPTVRTSSGG